MENKVIWVRVLEIRVQLNSDLCPDKFEFKTTLSKTVQYLYFVWWNSEHVMGVFTIGNGNENENQVMGINGMFIYCLV